MSTSKLAEERLATFSRLKRQSSTYTNEMFPNHDTLGLEIVASRRTEFLTWSKQRRDAAPCKPWTTRPIVESTAPTPRMALEYFAAS